MKKDIEWLKKWVEEYENKITKELGNKLANDFMTTRLHGGQSAVKEIKYRINQLDEPEVLKQELPVIPKFVAKHIEKYKDRDLSLLSAMKDATAFDLKGWFKKTNQELYARAYLDGYTVEKEQKYVVPLIKNLYLKQSESGDFGVGSTPSEMKYEFTEQEIKDYDPRYMTFAKPVKELEE